MSILGARIRQLHKAEKNRATGRRIRPFETYILEIEKGYSENPTVRTLINFLLLRVSVAYLLGEDEDQDGDPKLVKTIHKDEDLTPEQLEIVNSMVKTLRASNVAESKNVLDEESN